MTRRVWMVVLCGALATGLLGVTGARAAEASGVGWLVTNQDSTGLWGADRGTPFRDATAAVEALGALVPTSSALPLALGAILGTSTCSVDYLARRILANAAGNGGSDLSGLAGDLAGRQNTDGGWAYNRRYASNRLESALALQALKSAGYSNMTVLGNGVGYLTSRQNADFGWGFATGDPSQVFYTTHVLMALQALRGSFSVATAIQNGIAWLKTQDHEDGGFGTGLASNVYETALAVRVLAAEDSTVHEVTHGRDYLRATQLADGSWNEDAYSTALAVLALPREAVLLGVDEPVTPRELQFSVAPNPARNALTVALALPRADRVDVDVYDLSGRRVKALAHGPFTAGVHRVHWSMRSESGVPVASGAYYVRLRYGMESRTSKVVVTR